MPIAYTSDQFHHASNLYTAFRREGVKRTMRELVMRGVAYGRRLKDDAKAIIPDASSFTAVDAKLSDKVIADWNKSDEKRSPIELIAHGIMLGMICDK